MKRLLSIPYTFVLMNWAAIAALWCVVRGRGVESIWRDGGGPRGRRHPSSALHPSKP